MGWCPPHCPDGDGAPPAFFSDNAQVKATSPDKSSRLTFSRLYVLTACAQFRFDDVTHRRHASDWLPTWVEGVAGGSLVDATGPRPLDGHNLWNAWMTANSTSPRVEVIHQVVNKYNNLSATSAFCNKSSGQSDNPSCREICSRALMRWFVSLRSGGETIHQ